MTDSSQLVAGSTDENADLDAIQEIASQLVFPQSIGGYTGQIKANGITKREYFAAMAMQAILTGAVTRGCPSNEWVEQEIAVRCADALLKELAK